MKNEILKHDKGIMTSGKWFGQNDNFKICENIGIEAVERILDYKVEKLQAHTLDGKPIEKNHYLYRPDIEQVIFPNVGDVYHCMQNEELISYVEQIRDKYTNFDIESAVTLSNGQGVIINLNIMNHTVKGDSSSTDTRMTITNSFGRESLTVFLHQMRLSCANMLQMARAQGVVNKTFKRFKHTKTLQTRVGDHIFELADIVGEVKKHNENLDIMASDIISDKEVNLFLEDLFPTIDREGKGETMSKNKQIAVKDLYFNKEDLRDIPKTRYRLLNAVTDFTSHKMSMKGDNDQGKRFMSCIDGPANKVNQRAFELLSV
jgi:hypothetical protein